MRWRAPLPIARYSRLPDQPLLARNNGLNRLVYYVTFDSLGQIDVGNTGNPGYGLYPRTAWPNANAPPGTWTAGSPTDPSLLSVSNGVLEISDFTGTGQFSLASAISDGGSGYIGNVFSGKSCMRFQFKSNPALGFVGQSPWVVLWDQQLGFLTGTNTATNTFWERDIEEWFPSGTGAYDSDDFNNHDWQVTTGSVVAHDALKQSTGFTKDFNFHNVDSLWFPASLNGNVGKVQKAVDDVHYSALDITYSNNAGANPAFSPSNYNGILSEADSDARVIFVNAGVSAPIYLRSIQVWQ